MLFPDLVFPKPFVPSNDPSSGREIQVSTSDDPVMRRDIQVWGDPLWCFSLENPFEMPTGSSYPVTIGQLGYMVITQGATPSGVYPIDGWDILDSLDEPRGHLHMFHIAGLGLGLPYPAMATGYHDSTVPTKQIITDGNSLTAGAGADDRFPYPDQLFRLLSIPWKFLNVAVGGTTTQDMITRAATTLYPLLDPTLEKNILIGWEFTNDIFFGATAAEAISHWQTWCSNAQAAAVSAGVTLKIIALTILPRHEGSWSQAIADTCNAWLRDPARIGVEFDALADVASDPRLAVATPQYYVFDGANYTHLKSAGYAVVAQVVRPITEAM